ncbi:MAG: hypothetical protein QOF64_456 [Candidatus Binatota bacterium]|nr:hypothetical protein [Candidatus Binatota bacterium]
MYLGRRIFETLIVRLVARDLFNELPAQQAAGYGRPIIRTIPIPSPPNVFIGGPVQKTPVVSRVEPLLKACGKDGGWIAN